MQQGIYLGLGSNLGDRAANLQAAREALAPEVHVLRSSPVYETEPWGFTEQPAFLNQVLEVGTGLVPLALLKKLKTVEAELGRVESFRYGPRNIDLDILFYGEWVFTAEGLEIPHPRIAERAFVLVPLGALAPELHHPMSGQSVKSMLGNVDASGVRLYEGGKGALSRKGKLRTVAQLELPADLAEALAQDKVARESFQNLSFSHQREWLKWIEGAKRSETRARRIKKTINELHKEG